MAKSKIVKSCNKSTGTVYTPQSLADWMISYVQKNQKYPINHILEPSAGYGVFLEKLKQFNSAVDAVELVKEKAVIVSEQYKDVKVYNENYLEYITHCNKKYDLIIGNPPYIRKKYLSLENREISKKIVKEHNLPVSVFQNIWVSFILGSLNILSETGVLFFVLPFEFLQVQYPMELRKKLEERFNKINIITFEINPFTGILQDVCLVYMAQIDGEKPEINYSTLHSIMDFSEVGLPNKIMKNKPLEKWSEAILSDKEINLINTLSNKYPKIESLGFMRPGIVSAANDYFIVNHELRDKLQSIEYFSPIIRMSSYLIGRMRIDEKTLRTLDKKGEPIWLLNLNNQNDGGFSQNLQEYLAYGVKQGIDKRYKCSKRERWYQVPIVQPGDLLFFKRYNKIPRFVINDMGIFTTDIAYNISLNKEYDAESVIFCFYNSLTLASCERKGRFYGGGVAELIPSEFKGLPIPYQKIPAHHIEHFEELFKDENSLDAIIDYVDTVIFTDMKPEEKDLLREIRYKYLRRRLYFR